MLLSILKRLKPVVIAQKVCFDAVFGAVAAQRLGVTEARMRLRWKSLLISQMQAWLNFISAELHKGFVPLFNPATPAESKTTAIDKLMSRLKWLDGELAGKQYLMGDDFSVADPYLFTVTNWASRLGVDITGFANLAAYRERMAARPAVRTAMKDEGLIK